jgi:predicted Zn-dependent protease
MTRYTVYTDKDIRQEGYRVALIADVHFGVSLDELFDYNQREIEEDIEEIAYEAWKFRESDPEEGRRILEAGLQKYPANDILLNNLLYVLNYTENPDETIEIASALIEQTEQDDVRYDALRFLAYAYKAKGDMQSAEAAVEQIPEIYFSKLSELAFLTTGEKKQEAAEIKTRRDNREKC